MTSISGVDYVTNALQMVGGSDAESDASFKARFPNYLQSLARGTPAAITAAIEAIQPGVQVQVLNNLTYVGTYQPGFITIIVDDGSGDPPDSFIDAAIAAAQDKVAAGVQFMVYGPTIILVDVTFTIVTAPGYFHSNLVAAAEIAVETYIDTLLDGQTCDWEIMFGVIFASSPGITDVPSLLINGGTVDLVCPNVYNVFKAGTVIGT